MRNTLIDAWPLIALFDRSDRHHLRIKNFLKAYQGHLHTTWPVLTEACHLLDFSPAAQIHLLEWIDRGGIRIFPLLGTSLKRIIALSRKYSDVPMDLADASLVVAAEELDIREIISIDRDFFIYWTSKKRPLLNILYAEEFPSANSPAS